MHLPPQLIEHLELAAAPAPRLQWWQLSLRTLFILTAICSLLALLAHPAWGWAMELWHQWFPPVATNGCGPCGMG